MRKSKIRGGLKNSKTELIWGRRRSLNCFMRCKVTSSATKFLFQTFLFPELQLVRRTVCTRKQNLSLQVRRKRDESVYS